MADQILLVGDVGGTNARFALAHMVNGKPTLEHHDSFPAETYPTFLEDGAAAMVTAVLVIIPVVFMAVALQMLIASYTRNVKEAQTYTQLLSLAGFMPALFLAILPIKAQPWMNLVPTITQTFMINKVMRGEALPVGDVVVATAVTLLVGLVALAVAIRLYNRERIVLIG